MSKLDRVLESLRPNALALLPSVQALSEEDRTWLCVAVCTLAARAMHDEDANDTLESNVNVARELRKVCFPLRAV